MITVRRPVESCRAIYLRRIHINLLLNQGAYGRRISRLNHLDKRDILGSSLRRSNAEQAQAGYDQKRHDPPFT